MISNSLLSASRLVPNCSHGQFPFLTHKRLTTRRKITLSKAFRSPVNFGSPYTPTLFLHRSHFFCSTSFSFSFIAGGSLGNNNAICSRISEGTKIKLTSGDTGLVLDTSDIRAGGRGERLQHYRKSHFDMDVVLRLMF